MASTQSETFFERTLYDKVADARATINECIKQYLAPSPQKRQSAAKAAFDSVDRIFLLLHESDRPGWLNALHRDLIFATKDHAGDNGVIAVQRIASDLYPQMLAHDWKSGFSDDASGIEFDAVFERYRTEYRIPELFDELIKYLKEIVVSGTIDSVRAINELQQIIATLQRSKNGSYFATRSAWYFVAMWFKNTAWELLGTIPIAGSVSNGLRQTLAEIDEQMQKMHDSIHEDLKQTLPANFPRLEYQPPEIPRIEGPADDPTTDDEDNGT